MVLIGLIFATGFRKKRAILVPPHPWSIFVNISAVLKTSKTFNTKNIWMRFTLKCWCTGDILWYLVSSGQHHSCLAGENCRSGGAQHLLITLRRSFWYEVGGILMLFFFFLSSVSVVLLLILGLLDCWSLLLKPMKDYSAPVTAEMSGDTCLCCFAGGWELVCFNF